MKRIFLSLLFIAVCMTSYYDITKGTLAKKVIPAKSKSTLSVNTIPHKTSSKNTEAKYRKVTINPGDTVLSIVEKLNPNHHISISEVLKDFKQLNPNTNPNHIQIGKAYRFPLYNKYNQ